MLYFESSLTKQEEEARDIMVYLFNPVLKFILMSSNYGKFIEYGCNSCRQTAILGAGYLRKLLPDYEIRVHEGNFIEKINEKYVPYEHAFITAHKDDRHLVIDLSRTSKRLLFSQTYTTSYPEVEDYEDVVKISQDDINLDKMLNTDEPEYFTNQTPKHLMMLIETLIDKLKELSKEEQLRFCDSIYSKTTTLRR